MHYPKNPRKSEAKLNNPDEPILAAMIADDDQQLEEMSEWFNVSAKNAGGLLRKVAVQNSIRNNQLFETIQRLAQVEDGMIPQAVLVPYIRSMFAVAGFLYLARRKAEAELQAKEAS